MNKIAQKFLRAIVTQQEGYMGINYEPSLSDYDFPMSDTFRGWVYEHCGMTDPTKDHLVIEETIPEIHYVPVEPKAHMTRIKKLEDRFTGLENALIRLSQRKQKPYPPRNILINK